MRKIIYLVLGGALWLTACGSPTGNAPATLESAGVAGGETTPTLAPNTAVPTQAPATLESTRAAGGETGPTLAPTTAVATEVVAREVKADFVATDPGTVQLAAGKPQLVEFFAVW